MIIFSCFDNDKRFIEVKSFKDCEYIESDCYALIRINHATKECIESCIHLGKELHENDVLYAVLLDDYAMFQCSSYGAIADERVSYITSNSHTYLCKGDTRIDDRISDILPLSTLLFAFAKHGASFFILDEKNYVLLPVTQTLINYYLLDIKLLGLVDSYTNLEYIASWVLCKNPHHTDGLFRSDLLGCSSGYIGIDGVVEKGLLVLEI